MSLQPCRNPVITPDGYLYDKESILECLLHQKRENARKMKDFEKQKTKHQAELEELGKAEARSKVAKFLSSETSIVNKPVNPFSQSDEKQQAASGLVTTATKSSDGDSSASASKPKLPSFWIPAMSTVAKPTELKKPDMRTFCPVTGKILKVKDLISVKFTPADHGNSSSGASSNDTVYMCPITHDILGNSIPCAVIKPTGDVVTMECVDKLIRKEMVYPLTGQKLKDSDIIPLARGGTGFAGSGIALKATKSGPAMMS